MVFADYFEFVKPVCDIYFVGPFWMSSSSSSSIKHESKSSTRKRIKIGRVVGLYLHPDSTSSKTGQPMRKVDRITPLADGRIMEEPNRTFDHRPQRLKMNEDPRDRQLSFVFLETIKSIRQPLLTKDNFRANVVIELDKSLYQTPDEEKNGIVNLVSAEAVITTLLFQSESSTSNNDISPCGRASILFCYGNLKMRYTQEREPCRIMDTSTGVKGISKEMIHRSGGFQRWYEGSLIEIAQSEDDKSSINDGMDVFYEKVV